MQLTKKMAISIPLSLVAIFFSLRVDAYTFTQDFSKGFYWQSFPIVMKKFVTNSEDGPLLEELVNESVSEWENAIGKNIWEIGPVQTSSSYSGNFIRWSDNFGAETGFDPSKTLAITIRYNQGTFFQQTVIVLNGSLSYLRQNWGNALKITLLHEIGHTLGLDHSFSGTIMAPNLGMVSNLQGDDIDGVNAIVSETLRRQSTGYVSPFSTQETNKNTLAACGTVEDISQGKGGSTDNAVVNFLTSLLLGFLLIKVQKKLQNFV